MINNFLKTLAAWFGLPHLLVAIASEQRRTNDIGGVQLTRTERIYRVLEQIAAPPRAIVGDMDDETYSEVVRKYAHSTDGGNTWLVQPTSLQHKANLGQEHQPHTFLGERGDVFVEIRMRDIYGAVMAASATATGANSIADANLGDATPTSMAQNTCVAVEQKLGIYPNIKKLEA